MSVYSEIDLLRKLPIVSIANFSSFCKYIRQSNPTVLRKY
jgi:hypothetical protein